MAQTRKTNFTQDQLWTLEKLMDEQRKWLALQQRSDRRRPRTELKCRYALTSGPVPARLE
jgi:hypothetical protein